MGNDEKIANQIYREIEELEQEIPQEIKEEIKKDILERVRKEIKKKKLREKEEKKKREKYFTRFSLNIRAQHLILAIGVLILIITGLPIKFHESRWAEIYFKLTGGIQMSRILHRIGAGMLILVAIWHSVYLLMKEGRREFKELLPRKKDFLDFIHNIRYFLGFVREKPKFGRYSYIEKFDYWAVYWGMVIMIGSGALMWFHNLFLGLLPKFVLDIAREAHSDEALLATLAIVIWHWYNAHFNPDVFPFNWTIFTGKISEERMKHEHPLEYEKLKNKDERLKKEK